jgi:acyl-coenzyme A synthetase/AMP-(fatty) acid ligase
MNNLKYRAMGSARNDSGLAAHSAQALALHSIASTQRRPRRTHHRSVARSWLVRAGNNSASIGVTAANRADTWLQAVNPFHPEISDAGRGTDPVEIAVTSGSTGDPKGVLHVHDSAIVIIDSTIQRQEIMPSDIIHLAVPVGHTFGYFYGVRCALQSGVRGTSRSPDA